tara:strand:- start:243 stop:425 length:183 start_codon:yes stop_codon:yes gene_type:complete
MYVMLLIIKGILGMALMMLGVITFIHSGDHQVLGVLISFSGLIIFWSTLPSIEENRGRHE